MEQDEIMSTDCNQEGDAGKLTHPKAAMVLLILAIALTIYLVAAHFLGLIAVFAGNLVLFYWAGIEHFRLSALPSVLIGSLGGIWNVALFTLPVPVIGEAMAGLIGLAALLAAIYCLLVGWLPIIFNQAFMLALTVTFIPVVMQEAIFVDMSIGVLYGGLFWGGLVVTGKWIFEGLASRKAKENAA